MMIEQLNVTFPDGLRTSSRINSKPAGLSAPASASRNDQYVSVATSKLVAIHSIPQFASTISDEQPSKLGAVSLGKHVSNSNNDWSFLTHGQAD